MERTLIILTLNEIEGVQALIPHLPPNVADEVVAVDGGSTDGTIEFLQARNIPVYVQTRRGRGEAFRVGIANSAGKYVVFFSPDGNENPADIPKLFALLKAGADMVIASRFLPGARNEEDDDPLPFRKWTNQAFTLLANLFWNRGRPWISDTINGFRGIRREAFNYLAPTSLGYTIEYELTIGAMRAGMSIAEIPTIETGRIGGESKGPSLPTGMNFLRFFLSQLQYDLQKNRYFWPYLALTVLLLIGLMFLRPRSRGSTRR